MAQNLVTDIDLAVIGIDQRAVFGLGDGVDGEVAAGEVFFQRNIGRGEHLKTLVAFGGLALGASERILLLRFGVKKDRKILADRAIAQLDHLFRCGADHDEITVLDRQPE